MNLTKIISVVLLVVSLGLAYYLYDSIHSTIEFRKSIASTEDQIIKKLEIIREAEKVFLEQKGHYTSSWDSLINFIQNGVVPITVRTEKVIPLSYGADSIYVRIDTIGQVAAKEKIFKKTFTVNCADDGTFMGFFVNKGDEVIRGAKSYKLKKSGTNNPEEFTFLEDGTISDLADVKPGDEVTKGQYLITFWNYQFNPNFDISKINIIPESGKQFEIYVNKVDRNGVMVNIIHVWDPAPINPDRKASNEARNRQPLQFGSKTDVSTAGNWE